MAELVDLHASPPPVAWGVTVDPVAVDELANRWAHDRFELPAFDYPGTPPERDESWWYDYVTRSVSVLACLWPPAGEQMWATELHGEWLDDAPGIFAAFTRQRSNASAELFAGRGTLQLIPERYELLQRVDEAIASRWQGSVRNLVDKADYHGPRIAALLTETMPGYLDRPTSDIGVLPFDKLSHLAAAIMAAGMGWQAGGFNGYDDFPVYPDYMLPRVLRHFGVMVYEKDLAAAIDSRTLILEHSHHEFALRWATIYAGGLLRAALNQRGNTVTAPALDYRLWSEAVLGPDAANFGEHHRTITLHY